MSLTRLIIVSVVGFLIPIALAVYIAPHYFEYAATGGVTDAESSENLAAGSLDALNQAPDVPETASDAKLLSIESTPQLDPTRGQVFVVSLELRFERLPGSDFRQNIAAKYQATSSPYAGWAIAVHKFRTALRPEIYWKDGEGLGGWLSFNDYNFVPNQSYAITLLAKAGEFINLYVEELSEPIDSVDGASGINIEPKSDASRIGVQFLGGHNANNVALPRSSAALLVGSMNYGEKAFRGDVSSVLVGTIPEFPGKYGTDAKKLLAGGPVQLINRLKQEQVELFISASGVDESRFHRQSKLTGKTSWYSIPPGNP